jgi:Glycosyl transferase family 2
MSLPGVSIIMTPRDRTRLCRITLESIWAQEYPDLEICIVEDRPTEASLELLCKQRGMKYAARRCKGEDWMNPAPLLNHGLLMATKDIVLFQNAECRHERLDNLVNMVLPMVKAKQDQEPPISTTAYVQSLDKNGKFEQWFVHNKIGHRAGWISPFCQAEWRESAMKIKGFCTEFRGYGYDDDLHEAILRFSGVRIAFAENTLVSHMWHPRYDGDQRNGNDEIYKRIRREIEVGARPPVSNLGEGWGDI